MYAVSMLGIFSLLITFVAPVALILLFIRVYQKKQRNSGWTNQGNYPSVKKV